ncbi:MAG: hemolysin III family protein [Anaeroplasmataceae bacterium]
MGNALKKQLKEQKKLEKIEKRLKEDEKKRQYIMYNENEILENIERKQEYQKRNEPPKRETLEEIGNAVTHGIGALAAIAGMVLMIVFSKNGWQLFSAIVYGISMMFMMLMSSLYHSFKSGSKVKRIWRRFDYSSIYFLIGGTFTPIFLVYYRTIHPALSITLCAVQWGIIITGITIVSIFGPGRFKKIHYILYVLLGWCGIMFLPSLIKNVRPMLYFILGGGIAYTLGLIPFAMKKKAAHFIWHFFVLAGAVVQFLGILLYLY